MTRRFQFCGLFSTLLLAGALAWAPAANAQPGFSKVFVPDTIGPSGVSMLTFTITNGDEAPVTDLAFTDTLPAGVTIHDPAIASTNCTDAVLTAPAGGSTIALSDGSVGGVSSCTVTLQVTSSTPGTHMNVSGALTSSAGNSGTATDDLIVATDRPSFSKSFAPSSVALGGRSTLTFTIDNGSNPSLATSLTFTDNLPTGMVVANPPNIGSDCTAFSTPVVFAMAGGSIISMSNGSVAAGGSCTVAVDVSGGAAGQLDNLSSELTSTIGFSLVSSGKAAATLQVTVEPINLTKDFTDDPVAPGGTATLEFTVRNLDRNFSATDIAFTDDLGAALAGLTFASLLANDCGGTVGGVGTTMISFSGGSLGAGGSCTIRVSLTVPEGATAGGYVNTTGAISATVDGSPVNGNTAAETLFVAPFPVLTKEFIGDPVSPGENVTLRFTIDNPALTAATDITFSDDLTTILGFPVTGVTLPPVPNPPCGGGSSLLLANLPGVGEVELQGLLLQGGTLAAGDSCTFEVTLTLPGDLAPGNYLNTTSDITATVDSETLIGPPVSDTLQVVAAPRLRKVFNDDPAAPGGTVTLEFTLTHRADAMFGATGIGFTDDLANLTPTLAGLTANLPPTPDPPCGAGSSLTASAGSTLLELTGGTLAPGEDCTFSVTVNVPAGAAAGSYANTTSMVMANIGGIPTTSAPAVDSLDVSGLVFSKEFLDDPVIPGGTVTLRFTIDNVHPTEAAAAVSFDDSLTATLAGLTATGAPSVNTCGGSMSGTSVLIYSGGIVMSGETCTIEVELLVPGGTSDATYRNFSSSLTAIQGGVVIVDPAIDTLTVDSNLLQLTKEFTDDPVLPDTAVTLQFTVTNLDDMNSASSIAFTDNLAAALGGLTATAELFNDCGATVGLGGLVAFSDGSVGPGGSCTVRLAVQVPVGAGGDYVNTTSALTGTIGGLAVAGDPATDTLKVGVLTFTKTFVDPPPAAGQTVDLSFTIKNLSNSLAVSNIGFTDDLDAVIAGMTATPPMGPVCGAGSALAGSSLLALTGGALPPLGSCTFQTTLQVPAGAAAGDFVNQTSDLFVGGLPTAPPATAILQVIAVRQGDINKDGCIDRTDIDALNILIRTGSTNLADHDLNGDGVVNAADSRTIVGLFDNPGGSPCAP